ncbi:MAG TPA: hypothetical protein VF173_27595 [Thermoanaerobaculia bacterium]|nr:hypothetical protein [Thermoanaerobaculia bacterium]
MASARRALSRRLARERLAVDQRQLDVVQGSPAALAPETPPAGFRFDPLGASCGCSTGHTRRLRASR